MKIDGEKPPENADVVRLNKASKNEPVEPKEQARVSDRVDLSGSAKEIADILGAVRAIPEVRVEKVAELKERIETGNYVVEPAKVAQRMIDEII